MLVASAAFAAATHRLDPVWIVAAAASGAVVGDNIGYEIGRRLGYPALVRWGRHIGLGESKVQIARYLFAVHGPKVVFFGRFVALLRMLAALLAGVNLMPRGTFFVFNLAGGICWAIIFGAGGYLAGEQIQHLTGLFGYVLLAAGLCGCVVIFVGLRRREQVWAIAAEEYFAIRPNLYRSTDISKKAPPRANL